jgi:phospholipid/cholesterol/gamma-HCH transport system substrate-binding protein
MTGRRGGREALVGVVVAAAILIFAAGILVIGEQTQLFRPKVEYRILFATASGLRPGSPVTMSGVQVGGVQEILLPLEQDQVGIEVTIAVDAQYRRRVREGTEASLALLQYITNEKYIELSPGFANGEELREGTYIPVLEEREILETGKTIADNLEAMTVMLLNILEQIQAGEGLLGQAIMDPEFGQEGLASLKEAASGAAELLRRMNEGKGLAGRLVTDRELAAGLLEDLQGSISSLAAVMERLERGEGALGELLSRGEGEEDVRGFLEDLRASAASLRATAEKLEEGQGLAGRLLYDEEYGKRISAHLEETLASLASISRKIDQGEGSLGAMINDPSLYRAAEDMVFGARDSKIATWAVRHYREKGEKESLEERDGQ